MTKWKIYNEDAVEWAKNYQKAKFHALLTDAPYHLTSITKRFGKNGSAPAKFGKDGAFQRASKGFMGTQWDGGDIAFRPETWEAFGNVLHDGAFGMAFSASRNWHRMAVAIEDAGFILHPTIFLWAYGQGFPKATRVKGEEEFDGHRYGLQALKPAVEPIIVFQKPYEGKPVENIVRTGAGALNIDGGRIPLATDDEYTINTFDDGAKPFGNGAGHRFTSRKVKEDKRLGGNGSWKTDKAAKNVYEGGYEGIDVASSPLGRWPSNLILEYRLVQVLVLKYNISDDIKNTIQEFYIDYNKMQNLFEENESLSVKSESDKVLFQDVLLGVDESEHGRQESSHVRETPYGEVSDDDKQEQRSKKGQRELKVQGDVDAQRLSLPECERTSTTAEGNGNKDASKESRRDTGASAIDGNEIGKTVEAQRTSPSSQRNKGRQSVGESGSDGQLNSQEIAQGSNKGVASVEIRKRELKVLACDIPNGWLKYFEETGQEVSSPYCSARRLDAQTGNHPTGGLKPYKQSHDASSYSVTSGMATATKEPDSGGASRFFYQVSSQLDEADPAYYCAKVSPKERNAGLDEYDGSGNVRTNAPRENEDVKNKELKNPHPTLKPIGLCRYLATLLLPPVEYAPRRIFVPFSGVASEMIGCGLAGWEHVVGVEFDTENGYVDIAEKRLEHWLK